jgi:hypothetical protein
MQNLQQWFWRTPERALDSAYKCALEIKRIEDQYFDGQTINPDSGKYGSYSFDYFQASLNKLLSQMKIRMAEFRVSRLFLNSAELNTLRVTRLQLDGRPDPQSPPGMILGKLEFIDATLARYNLKKQLIKQIQRGNTPDQLVQDKNLFDEVIESDRERENLSNSTGLLPRTILGTFTKIRRDLDPKFEQEDLKKYRVSRLKTAFTVKFLLTLLVIPILTHQISKSIVITPIMNRVWPEEIRTTFINADLEQEALNELDRFQRKLELEAILGQAQFTNDQEKAGLLRERAEEISREFRGRSTNAVKNIFADALAIIALVVVLLSSKRDIVIFKSFIDDLAYGLSDSAKAFMIIIFTDMFVGFHSPHGWEIILERVAKHLGLPENRDFIFLFIATFPVILDSVIKYWIFRYLNRISPSAVATYKNMNE